MLPACDALTLDDLMVGETASPDGQLVARAWCEDGCDQAEGRTITISPAGTSVTSRLPQDDLIERVDMSDGDAAIFSMRWTSPRTLQISGECLHDGNFEAVTDRRWRGIVIDFVSLPSATPCPEPRA